MTAQPRWSLLKIGAIAGVLFAILLACVVILSLVLLDSDWLRAELERQAESSLQAEVSIGDMEFSPWSGHVELTDFTLKRDHEGDKLDARMKQAEANVSVAGLIFRRVNIERLHFLEPEISIEETREPEPDAKATIERVKDAGRELLKDLAANKPTSGKNTSKALKSMRIGELRVENGRLSYTAHREGVEPFIASLDSLDYAASDITPNSLDRFLTDCALQSGLTMGSNAKVEYHSDKNGSRLQIEGLDLGYADRYLSQKDSLVFQGGTMHVSSDSKNGSMMKVRIENLRLTQNMNSPTKEFYFIPADKLVEYVNSKSGNLDLEFKHDASGMQGSEDLEAIVLQFWDGLCLALVDEARKALGENVEDAAKSLLDKGKGFIRDSLKKDEAK